MRLALSRILSVALLAALSGACVARAAPPVVVIDAPDSATTGQPVAFDGEATTDPDGDLLDYAWSIDGQALDVESSWLSVAFAHPGNHVVALTATDSGGASATGQHTISVTGADKLPSSLKPLGTSLVPGVTAAPELVVRAPKIRVRKRQLRVVLRCRGAERCRGTLRIVALVGAHQAPFLLSQRRFDIASGGPRVVHARLGPKARRRLRHHRLVRATAFQGKVRVATIWGTMAYRVPLAR